MAKGRYTSNAGVFAKRGDPWVTRREGEKNFGRNVDTENPDFDQFFATKPKPRPVYVEPPRPVKPAEASYSQRKTNIILRAKRQAGSVKCANPADENPFERFTSRGIVDE